MRTHPLHPNLVLVLTCLLTVLLFFMGIAGGAAHFWGRYLLPIIAAFLWGRRRDIYIVAALASALVAAEYWAGSPADPGDLLINHLLYILILWAAAWLLARRHAGLEASEQRFAEVFRTNPGGMAISRASDGCFLDANPAYLQMLGYTKDELVGRTSIDLGILSAAARAQIIARINEQSTAAPFETQLRTKTGATVDVMTAIAMIELGGEPCLLTMAVNVTTLKAAESDRLFLSALVASSPEAVVGRTVNGTILSWNRAAEQLFGYTAEEAVGQNLTMLATPDGLADMEEVMAETARGNAVEGVETRRMTKDGYIFDCRISSFPVRDAGGEIIGVASFTHDISERKAAEKAMRDAEARFAAAFQANFSGLCITRVADGAYIDANPAYLAMLGYDRGELIGHTPIELGIVTAEANADQARARHARGAASTIDAYLYAKDGRRIDILTSVNPIHLGGEPCRLIVAFDITERNRLEEDLRQSESKWRNVFEFLPVGVSVVDNKDHVTDTNSTLAQILQMTSDGILQGAYAHRRYFHSDHSPMLPSEFASQRALREGRVVRDVVTGIEKEDGELIWVSVSATPASLKGYAVTVTADITARKRAEEALAASEAQLRAVIENTADNVWSVDRSYRILVTNSVFGRNMERQIGRPLAVGDCVITDPFPLSIRNFWQPLYDRALAGESVMLEMPSSMYAGHTLAVYLHPIYTADGIVTGVSGRTADVTALKQAEAQLRAAYQQVRLAADAANIGIWNWNFADDSLDWDDRICDFYAVPRAMRATGIYYGVWREHVHPDDLAANEASLAAARRNGTEWSSSFRIVLPGGEVRYIYSASVVERDAHGVPQRMIGINRDITDQKRYEQLLQDTNAVLEQRVAERTAELQGALGDLRRANELKDEFMAMISHELRTPLTGVLSLSEMLEEQIAGPLNERQSFYVKGIITSGERLLNVVNGILSYTHLLSGKVQLQAEPCEFSYLLDVCAASQRHKTAEKQQSIAVQVEPPDLAITSDANALAEVLKRLLDNAVKFTPAGGEIGLEAHLGAAPGTVDLVVWDTGIGIAPDQHEHVFRAFTQTDGRLQRSHEGIGMGLAYVDQMVRLLGGRLALESVPGQGSRFTITLPAQPFVATSRP